MKLKFLIAFLLLAFASQAQLCPDSLQVISKTKNSTRGDTLILQAKYKNGLGAIPTYNWSVSEASILSGQGTATILIATSEMDGDYITATVQLSGYSNDCNTVASETIYVMKEHSIYEQLQLKKKPATKQTKRAKNN
jgi:hypothetical protein